MRLDSFHEEGRPVAAPPTAGPGSARFTPSGRGADALEDLRRRRLLCVRVPAAGRGGLRGAIDDAVEVALAMRGALPPRVEVGAELGAVIVDQMFRALALGDRGLALVLPRLDAGDGERAALCAADSATLVTWLAAARDAPIALLFQDADERLPVLAPVPLSELVGRMEALDTRPAAPHAAPAPAAPPPEPPAPEAPPPRPALFHAKAPEAPPPPAPARRAPASLARAVEAPTPEAPVAAPAAARAEVEAPPPAREPPRPPRGKVVCAAEWRALAVELDAARGPKPVRIIEQLFATHYMPLLGAVLAGEADAAVRGVVDAWRTTFENSYRDAFSAVRATGKRPPMVFDAPEIAARLGRLNGARAVKLLLVDAMRFDVGDRVAARLKERTEGRAILVERSLLWSALPTTTAAQLELLARGPEALRDAAPQSEPEPAIARGRAVATLRRERVGSRELMKLDLVEARLRTAGPPYAERLDAIADEVTDVVARFIETLPPRTVLLVFGDHGFRIAPAPDGSTGPATQGGSTPEEVLVPAQAWLVGGVH